MFICETSTGSEGSKLGIFCIRKCNYVIELVLYMLV